MQEIRKALLPGITDGNMHSPARKLAILIPKARRGLDGSYFSFFPFMRLFGSSCVTFEGHWARSCLEVAGGDSPFESQKGCDNVATKTLAQNFLRNKQPWNITGAAPMQKVSWTCCSSDLTLRVKLTDCPNHSAQILLVLDRERF